MHTVSVLIRLGSSARSHAEHARQRPRPQPAAALAHQQQRRASLAGDEAPGVVQRAGAVQLVALLQPLQRLGLDVSCRRRRRRRRRAHLAPSFVAGRLQAEQPGSVAGFEGCRAAERPPHSGAARGPSSAAQMSAGSPGRGLGRPSAMAQRDAAVGGAAAPPAPGRWPGTAAPRSGPTPLRSMSSHGAMAARMGSPAVSIMYGCCVKPLMPGPHRRSAGPGIAADRRAGARAPTMTTRSRHSGDLAARLVGSAPPARRCSGRSSA